MSAEPTPVTATAAACLFFTPSFPSKNNKSAAGEAAADGSSSSSGSSPRLAYSFFGPASAPLVLFIPGAGLGRLSCPLPSSQLEELNLRLLLVDRPGYGGSDAILDDPVMDTQHPSFRLRRLLDAFSFSLAQLLTHLSLEKVTAIGHSAGALHLMNFVQLFPERMHTATFVGMPSPM